MSEEDGKKLFVALVEGKELKLKEILKEIVMSKEYNMAINGGEPDLEYMLILRLYEEKLGYEVGYSLVNSDEWREHALKEK